jgi:hypothetical protein
VGLALRAVEAGRPDEIIYLTEPHSSKVAANLIAQSVVHGQVCRRQGPYLLHRPDGTVCHITDVVVRIAAIVHAVARVLEDAKDHTATNARAAA